MKTLRLALISLVGLTKLFAGVDPDVPKQNSALFQAPVQTQIIEAHNALRTKVGVPPLAWSDQLATVAQRYANHLMMTGAFEHSKDDRYGENLFEILGDGAASKPTEVVEAWGAESNFYKYKSNSCTSMCGHYTQIVWRDTRAVGCGSARDANKEVWVCNYAPYGNIIGEKPF